MDIKKLTEILLELRQASMQIRLKPTEENFHEIIHKYDMIFCGGEFNIINSIELAHSLKTVFNIPVDNETLIGLIPTACKILNMKYEPLINLSDSGKPNPPIASYQITL